LPPSCAEVKNVRHYYLHSPKMSSWPSSYFNTDTTSPFTFTYHQEIARHKTELSQCLTKYDAMKMHLLLN